jgi:hypothetical protein
VGHSDDRARDRVYHSLLLLGSHSGYRRRRLKPAAKLLTKDEAGRIEANVFSTHMANTNIALL